MHELYELKDMLMQELCEYGRKGELTGGSLDVVDKLAHSIKNLCKIIEASEDEEEYSMAGSYAGNSQNGSYARSGRQSRNSYARGRNARRNSMGRYSRDGYSQEGGEELAEMLRSKMNELPQNVQMDAQKLADKLEQSMR